MTNERPGAIRLQLGAGLPVRPALDILVLLLLPLISLATYNAYFAQVGGIDAWIYTGLIHNYDDVVDRTGPTYYPTRIAHIFPQIFLNSFLGATAGFFVYKYLLLLGVCAAAYGLARRWYGRDLGIVAAALAASTPWLLPSLASDLYDGTVVVYLFIALAFAFAPVKRKILAHALAGVCAGVAAHTYQLAAICFAAAAPAWFLIQSKEPISRLLLLAAVGAAAAAAAYFGLNLLLLATNPAWEKGNPVFAVGASLLSGGGRQWLGSIDEILSLEYYYALTPLLLGIGLLGLCVFRRRHLEHARVAIACALLPISQFAAYGLLHATGSGVFRWSFTIILLFPGALLAAIALLGEQFFSSDRPRPIAAFLSVAICLVAMVLDRTGLLSGLDVLTFSTFAVLAALLLVAVPIVSTRQPYVAGAVGLSAVLFVLYSPLQISDRERNPQQTEHGWQVRNGIFSLMDIVHATSPPKAGRLGFWYADSDTELYSMQSAYLWGYTRLSNSEASTMPELAQSARRRLNEFDRMMMLSQTHDELDVAQRNLADAAAESHKAVRVLADGASHDKGWSFMYRLVALDIPAAPTPGSVAGAIARIDVNQLNTAPGWEPAKTEHVGSVALITSYPTPGGFSSWVQVPGVEKQSGAGVLRVWVKVTRGAFRLIPTSPSDPTASLGEPVLVGAKDQVQLVEVRVKDLSANSALLFANEDSTTSTAEVSAIEIAQSPR